MKSYYLLCFCLLTACSSPSEGSRRNNQVASYIDRHHDEYLFTTKLPSWQAPERYLWESSAKTAYPTITKEFFRCRCSSGAHSLPVRDGKEGVYPILIDLANYIQDVTGRRIVITSGHRCPDHNKIVDPSVENATSKHLVAAEASFYVEGLETRPELIIDLLLDYYKRTSKYAGDGAYVEFARYDKDTDVTTPPWFNKEIFVKLYQKHEGRNADNNHPYPYISVQVRYDWDTKERVQYTWRAARTYFRY